MNNKSNKNIVYIFAGLISVVILTFLDQITKWVAVSKLAKGPFVLIEGVFEFHYLSNYGMAWGMFSGQRIYFIVLTVIIVALISYIYVITPKTKKYLPLHINEILIISGALGNFIDRVFLGYVRDFIYFSLIDFPIFNIADCYVVVSAFLLLILVMFVYKDEDFAFITFKKKKVDNE